ncbi:MAG: class IV adenylate cyclase [Candidatus Acidoferrales bacterium]
MAGRLMRRAGTETEIKLSLGPTAAARRGLARLGFRVIQPRSLERNLVFDTPGRALRRSGCLLRLRSWNGRHWLTFKGPADFSRHFKVRTERETELSDPEAVRAAFAALGLQTVFRYEKFRAVYAAGGRWRGGEVMLDETPIGNFLELEGSRSWIRRVARALGARPQDFITQSYASLYADWCRRRRRRVGEMVFHR